MNKYVAEMKDTVKHFYSEAQNTDKLIKSAQEKYSEEYASSEIKVIKARLEIDYTTANQMIQDIFNEVKEKLAIMSFPNVEQLTSDRLLFTENTGIDLTIQEVESFIERYKDNPTMLRVISNWIEKNHSGMGEYTTLQKNIIFPQDRVEVYKKFGQSALSLIDTIFNSTDLTGLQVMIDSFANEEFAKDLFNIIGDGRTLKDTSTFRVPEKAKHCFDDITL